MFTRKTNAAPAPGADRQALRSLLTRRYALRFVGAILVLTAGLIVCVLLSIFILGLRIWYVWDPMYQFFSALRDSILLVFFVCWVAGAFIILIWQFRGIVKDILALTDSIGDIAAGGAAEPRLSSTLREVQTELQKIQYDILRNAQIAKEAEQRKDDLVVYLAHDLKTPLTSVIGYLTLLRDEPDISPELRNRYLSVAVSKALRLEDLVNEFFDITRFSLKGLVLESGCFNFSLMLEQVVDEFKPIFAEKQLNCVLELQPGIELLADAGKLERVVDNLLRNAAGYSHPGGDVLLSAQAGPAGVTLEVSNTGDDIPPHKLAHIFEQFYRVDASRSGEQGGSGLGLAIAKEIVELHGGQIGAESNAGHIRFLLTLPPGCLKPAANAAPAQAVLAQAAPSSPL